MIKSTGKKKSITVFSEGARYDGLRRKDAYTWVVSEDQTVAARKPGTLQAGRDRQVTAAREAIFASVRDAHLCKDDKRNLRRMVTAMSDDEVLAFWRKLQRR
jgi:hypothetical protein